MIRGVISSLFITCIFSALLGQMQVASLDSAGRMQIETSSQSWIPTQRNAQTLTPMDGFPIVVPADRTFKNFRNVTLHDLNADGSDELIFGVADRLFCYSGANLLWSFGLTGICRFPAAVADLDLDGRLEIVILTGYNSEPGAVYVFSSNGQLCPGWPQDYGGFWKLSSPALADLDGDADLEIVFGDLHGSSGAVHAVHHDGTVLEGDWPFDLPNIPASTPSIADLDRDGDKEVVIPSTREIYALQGDGTAVEGWPQSLEGTKFSFQSPVLANVDGDEALEIIGTGHGDVPLFYALDATGRALSGWPIDIAGGSWSFHPPSLIHYQGSTMIVNARPGGSQVQEIMFVHRPDGMVQAGYPLSQMGGHEGISTIVDMDGDTDPDLVFSTNVITPDGDGFIFAYDLISANLLEGFPLMQKGWTYMNGATFGDLDGDGNLEMVALSFTDYPDDRPDTAYIFAYALEVQVKTWWPTYKGTNLRDGFADIPQTTAIDRTDPISLQISPNPASEFIEFGVKLSEPVSVHIYNLNGALLQRHLQVQRVSVESLPAGIYLVSIDYKGNRSTTKLLIDP